MQPNVFLFFFFCSQKKHEKQITVASSTNFSSNILIYKKNIVHGSVSLREEHCSLAILQLVANETRKIFINRRRRGQNYANAFIYLYRQQTKHLTMTSFYMAAPEMCEYQAIDNECAFLCLYHVESTPTLLKANKNDNDGA